MSDKLPESNIQAGRQKRDAWVSQVLSFDVTTERARSGNGTGEGDTSDEKYLVTQGKYETFEPGSTDSLSVSIDSNPSLGSTDSSNGSISGGTPEKYLKKDDEGEYPSSNPKPSDSLSISLDSTSSDSTGTSYGGGSGERHPDSPLPSGVDLSETHMGKSIKSGAFGSVSWLDGAKGTPPLVIKVPLSENTREELEHESEFYAKIGTHENIVTCLGMQTIDGKQGLVLEGIKGGDMRKVMSQLEKLSKADPQTAKQNGMDRALSHEEYMGTMQYMLRETLKGLAFLEEKGVVHTDIRPDNIMCDSETGQVKIVDFGLAHDSDQERQARKVPIGHGMVAPEQITPGMTVKSNVDVFATGELMRRTMEGDQFRYNKDDLSQKPNFTDLQKFAKKDNDGNFQQSLNPMPKPLQQQDDEDGDEQSPHDRMSDLRSRISTLLKDPLLKQNKTVVELGQDIQAVSRTVGNLGNVDDKEIDALEARMGVAERSFKTSGGYRAITSYTEFVNWAMHPDPSQRPSAKEALNHPFLQDSLLDDDQARGVLKKMLNVQQQPQTVPLDSGSDSTSITSVDLTSVDTTGGGDTSLSGKLDENGFLTRRDDQGYTVFLTANGGWSRNKDEAAKQPPPSSSGSTSLSGTLDDEGFLTSRDDQGYTIFLTANGNWSRNKDEAAKQPPPSSSGSTSRSGTLDDEGFLTSRDNQGYTVFLTANGGWSRNKDEAAKQSRQPSSGSTVSSSGDSSLSVSDDGSLSVSDDGSMSFSSDSSVPPDEHDGSGQQYEDLTNTLRNSQSYSKPLDQTEDVPENSGSVEEGNTQQQTEPLYDETPDLQPENQGSEQRVSSQSEERTDGWTQGKRSEEKQRGGPTIGKGRVRGTETKGGTQQPEQTGNWTQGKPSDGTGQGGQTIGKGRVRGTGNQGGTLQPEQTGTWTQGKPSDGTGQSGPTIGKGRVRGTETKGGTQQPEQTGTWTQGKPSDGTGRGGPTIGKGRRGATSNDDTQPRPDENPQGWTGGRPRSGTTRGGGPTIGRGRRGD